VNFKSSGELEEEQAIGVSHDLVRDTYGGISLIQRCKVKCVTVHGTVVGWRKSL
jgi:hypothetical protein